MLQAIRVYSQGWFAWLIVGLISVPFALWGIQEYVKVGAKQSVAKVNGYEIQDRDLSQRVQQTRLELRRRLGKAYRPELIEQTQLRKEVLEGMIRNQLVINHSLDMGLRVGDGQVRAAIMAVPAFQKDGKFDSNAYQQMLSTQGTTSIHLEEQIRMSLMANQMSRVIASSEFTTEQDLAEVVRLRRQQRSFKYFVLSTTQFIQDTPIAEAELNNYYQTHRDTFEIPEQVKLDYILLEQADVSSAIADVTDASLQELYKSRLSQYRTPEQRHVRHILVTINPKATPDEEGLAKKRIADIRARVTGGADFAVVAKESSEDPGSASQGGDLGLVGRGVMVPEFEQAAFSLSQGVLSEPVRSAFGLHLIEVTKIVPEQVKPFAEVRDELATSAKTEELTRHYLRIAEQLGNFAYEHIDSLEPAAQSLGLKIQHSDWLPRIGGTGIFANPGVMDAAFADEVLTQGNNSELIDITEGTKQRAIVLRVADHQDVAVKPLSEVKEQIVTALRQEQATKTAFKHAETLAERLRKDGEDIVQVASGYELKEQPLIQRDAIKDIAPEIVNAVFKLPVSKVGNVSVEVVQINAGATAVVMLDEIQDGKLADLDVTQRETESKELVQNRAQAYYENTLDDLRQRADVWIAPQSERVVVSE